LHPIAFSLGLWILAATATANAAPVPPECADTLNFPVVVDDITFQGDSRTSPAVLAGYFDIPRGRCLARADLDAGINDARARLDGTGEYRTVVIELNKGAGRNHYLIAVTLEPYRPYYFGSRHYYIRNTEQTATNSTTEKYAGIRNGIYGGTRDFLSSRTRVDLDLDYLQSEDQPFDDSHRQETTRESQTSLNIFHPNLFIPGLILGLNASHIHANSKYQNQTVVSETNGDRQVTTEEDRVVFDVQSFFVKAGYRVDWLTITPMFGRVAFKARYESDDHSDLDSGVSEHDTYAGFITTLTNKTQLASVEPGFFAKLSYQRTVGPKWEYPAYTATFEQTAFLVHWLALTPDFRGYLSYEDLDDPQSLFRTYEFGLRNEFIPNRSWVFLVRPSVFYAVYSPHAEFFRKLEMAVSWINPYLNVQAGFILGSYEEYGFDRTDRRRITE